jgi:hypothetical protein
MGYRAELGWAFNSSFSIKGMVATEDLEETSSQTTRILNLGTSLTVSI